MFGSKLRSWMETHIVRPRKNKGNKNKQAENAAGGSSGNSSSSKKAGTLPPNSNLKSATSPVLTSSGSHSIASPVRRREVSPIQCHTPSRYGWQSPDQDNSITSPKSDNLLYAPHRYQRHQTLPPLQQQQQQLQQPQLSVPSKDSCSSSADKSPMRVNCSSSSISSLSWSTGSKEPSSAKQQLNYKLEPAEDEVDYEEVGALLLRPQPPLPLLQDYQRPNSENLLSLQLVYEEDQQQQQQHPKKNSNHVHYGRLLPSKLATVQLVESLESLTMTPPQPPPPPSVTNQLSRMRAPRAGLPRGNFMPGPRPHSLSSPESAYSTGYSTDGTSPCAASSANPPAPEYYINMRTGTHYFPSRSVNSERYKFGLNRIEEMSPMDPLPKSNFGNTLEPNPSPLVLQHKLFESPSPRQRSRIRTNPWYNTAEHMPAMPGSSRSEPDATSTTSTTSSGIKSSNELEMRSAKITTTIATTTPAAKALAKTTGIATPTKLRIGGAESSEGSSSSSTEVENLHAPHTIKRRHLEQQQQQQQQQQQADSFLLSDDEATLNEMIGKFDESYVYEKETDILSSDSDPTDCASELDTGQDAGDECDTDELLDIDFIDTSSMQEVVVLQERQDQQRNLGSCHYYPTPSPLILRRSSTRSRRRSGQDLPDCSQQRRRKRFLKTRKKSCENREKVQESPLREPRGSRSVGGTPVCLRRQLLSNKERIYKTSPLSNRSNSLIFGRANEPHFMTIAESEKALLKADLEADMKYKQLIMEAESLLESMKNSLQSIPRDTPVASPRRLNPLANKRVEMLKHSEVDSKKQMAPPTPPLEHELAAAINKRIELLKFETTATASPPNSPKPGRCSPRKTHLTNFINQNAPPELPPRKLNTAGAPPSPQLQLNGRRLQSGCSPRAERRAMHALQCINGSDSEQECIAVVRQSIEDVTNHNYLQQQQEQQQQPNYNQLDYNNRNVAELLQQQDNFYCPHSEPLKRKVYKGSSSFERIKKTFDLELDMSERPKTQVKRQQSKLSASVSAKSSMQDVTVEGGSKEQHQQLILSTIVDLKRSLEHQSYELSGLTEE
ncbi:uncharacterized protein LOC6559219 isoform X2 [Drosophila grimshawi]|uniref:GH19838 n=1 Tax=Drosophila grimshawi TaxID=7222 RepID=B4J9M4_DROGR|nr:uncharacterized protein LOC6559219 isoform X2 [Drosophila grimshawi]EDW02531.1 GH19838 [Drosophila grimshawi]